MPHGDSNDEERTALLARTISSEGSSSHGSVVIPVATPASPTKQNSSNEKLKTSLSSDASKPTVGICRICLEEDSISNLEAPCGCSGTQQYAHHDCIQRWVDEKGNAKCEICEQPYRGSYVVPPPPSVTVDNMPIMYILESSDPRIQRAGYDIFDDDQHMMMRNPSVSWCITFIVFFMFLLVLHHTLIIADGVDYDADGNPYDPTSGYNPGAGMSPSRSDFDGPDSDDSYGNTILIFVFQVLAKALFIGIPLYTVMKIAARQARREQYEVMLRAGAAYEANRRMIFQIRSRRDATAASEAAGSATNPSSPRPPASAGVANSSTPAAPVVSNTV